MVFAVFGYAFLASWITHRIGNQLAVRAFIAFVVQLRRCMSVLAASWSANECFTRAAAVLPAGTGSVRVCRAPPPTSDADIRFTKSAASRPAATMHVGAESRWTRSMPCNGYGAILLSRHRDWPTTELLRLTVHLRGRSPQASILNKVRR